MRMTPIDTNGPRGGHLTEPRRILDLKELSVGERAPEIELRPITVLLYRYLVLARTKMWETEDAARLKIGPAAAGDQPRSEGTLGVLSCQAVR